MCNRNRILVLNFSWGINSKHFLFRETDHFGVWTRVLPIGNRPLKFKKKQGEKVFLLKKILALFRRNIRKINFLLNFLKILIFLNLINCQ